MINTIRIVPVTLAIARKLSWKLHTNISKRDREREMTQTTRNTSKKQKAKSKIIRRILIERKMSYCA